MRLSSVVSVLLFCLFQFSGQVFAQGADSLFFGGEIASCADPATYRDVLLADYGIVYHDPQGFNVDYGYGLCLDPDKWIAQEYAAILKSKDNQCIVFLPLLKAFHRDVWRTVSTDFQFGFRMVFERQHYPIVWDNYITKVSGAAAKKKYNADTLYFYQLPDVETMLVYPKNNADSLIVLKDYPFNTKMIVSKRDKMPFHLLFLFSAEGLKNKELYLKSFEHCIRYIPG